MSDVSPASSGGTSPVPPTSSQKGGFAKHVERFLNFVWPALGKLMPFKTATFSEFQVKKGHLERLASQDPILQAKLQTYTNNQLSELTPAAASLTLSIDYDEIIANKVFIEALHQNRVSLTATVNLLRKPQAGEIFDLLQSKVGFSAEDAAMFLNKALGNDDNWFLNLHGFLDVAALDKLHPELTKALLNERVEDLQRDPSLLLHVQALQAQLQTSLGLDDETAKNFVYNALVDTKNVDSQWFESFTTLLQGKNAWIDYLKTLPERAMLILLPVINTPPFNDPEVLPRVQAMVETAQKGGVIAETAHLVRCIDVAAGLDEGDRRIYEALDRKLQPFAIRLFLGGQNLEPWKENLPKMAELYTHLKTAHPDLVDKHTIPFILHAANRQVLDAGIAFAQNPTREGAEALRAQLPGQRPIKQTLDRVLAKAFPPDVKEKPDRKVRFKEESPPPQ